MLERFMTVLGDRGVGCDFISRLAVNLLSRDRSEREIVQRLVEGFVHRDPKLVVAAYDSDTDGSHLRFVAAYGHK
jgi:hypothetical protein